MSKSASPKSARAVPGGPLEVEEALLAENRVVGLHGVALGEHEAIAVGVVHGLGRDAQVVLVEHHEGVDDGHVAADVAARTRHDDVDAVAAQVPAKVLELSD